MYCPFCGATDTRVIDSRLAAEGSQVRRRRECSDCEERFTSFETAELVMPRIVKSDGTVEPFDDEKLRRGLAPALYKRPVSAEDLDTVISRITRKLRSLGEREVESHRIGELVMHELSGLDRVAYVRYASVYHSFEDVSEFRDEVEKLENELTPEARKHQMRLLQDDNEDDDD